MEDIEIASHGFSLGELKTWSSKPGFSPRESADPENKSKVGIPWDSFTVVTCKEGKTLFGDKRCYSGGQCFNNFSYKV